MAYDHKHYQHLHDELDMALGETSPEFEGWLQRLHDKNHEVNDGALFEVYQRADEFANELFACFSILSKEQDERGKNGSGGSNWYHVVMIDGLAHVQSKEHISKVRAALWREMQSHNEDSRYVAMTGLQTLGNLGDKEARKILWDARTYTLTDDEETKRFQNALEKILRKK